MLLSDMAHGFYPVMEKNASAQYKDGQTSDRSSHWLYIMSSVCFPFTNCVRIIFSCPSLKVKIKKVVCDYNIFE